MAIGLYPPPYLDLCAEFRDDRIARARRRQRVATWRIENITPGQTANELVEVKKKEISDMRDHRNARTRIIN